MASDDDNKMTNMDMALPQTRSEVSVCLVVAVRQNSVQTGKCELTDPPQDQPFGIQQLDSPSSTTLVIPTKTHYTHTRILQIKLFTITEKLNKEIITIHYSLLVLL